MGLGENMGDILNSEPHSTRFVILFRLIVLVSSSVLHRDDFLLFILMLNVMGQMYRPVKGHEGQNLIWGAQRKPLFSGIWFQG